MDRILVFDQEKHPEHSGYYSLLQDAMQAGSEAVRRKRPDDYTGEGGRLARKSEARIRRALLAVGKLPDDAPELKKDTGVGIVIDTRRRVLNGAGEVKLDQPDFKRLTEYVQETPWLMHLSEDVSELEDWLDATEKREAAKPQAVEDKKRK